MPLIYFGKAAPVVVRVNTAHSINSHAGVSLFICRVSEDLFLKPTKLVMNLSKSQILKVFW